VPTDPVDLAGLEQQRSQLYDDLSQVGDFRRGALNAVRRKCGRPNCACADPAHPGHGPQYNLTRSVDGRTVNRHLKAGPELEKVRGEVARYEQFRVLVAAVTEVNEAICQVRPVPPLADGETPAGPGAEKGGSSSTSRRSSPPR
jgi:hypothetical protein